MEIQSMLNNEPEIHDIFNVDNQMHSIMKKRKKGQHLTVQMQNYLSKLFHMFPITAPDDQIIL